MSLPTFTKVRRIKQSYEEIPEDKRGKPKKCAWCKEEWIPLGHIRLKRVTYFFCSVLHGKNFLKRYYAKKKGSSKDSGRDDFRRILAASSVRSD